MEQVDYVQIYVEDHLTKINMDMEEGFTLDKNDVNDVATYKKHQVAIDIAYKEKQRKQEDVN